MKANIISIGNSQGIILPASILRQLNLSFKSTVQVEVDNGAIIIRPEPRLGWAEAAQQMQAEKDDQLLLDDLPNDFEKEEWTW
ncbi:AbrB/MazE/SpoVT family DNA-binding domain-containing protein [Dyadobacter pollutisoli]|uniref:AbrB/MazE/SpoVT family DNA-binding domain-containing protein n=1 Tax=Dyadobacter pollutisoli TaxID=2910158 RepID=A0A9E8NG52_9BACT|nr:AbrB/MazE/SpoVT family DNA-binding domain-containing protein [Dyadobacter pollutisoli]WAC14683.1 AbrB/MazE/SpoVT family DNA-binding domain-containing protein [Dyadobacter pollutisoli]